jgi:hypothetical protein
MESQEMSDVQTGASSALFDRTGHRFDRLTALLANPS